MTQVNISSFCTTQNPKVSCETLAGDDSPPPEEETPAKLVIDYAPESFWLSKDSELDWLDRNAFLDRKDSGKGSFNPNQSSNSLTSSNRYTTSKKPKTLIIGLPKSQKLNYDETKYRRSCKPANIRFFPKRSEPVGDKPGLPVQMEPSSPKVSCIGRVRSRKERSKRGKNRKKQAEPGLVKVRSIKEKKTGFWSKMRFMFRSKKHETGCNGSNKTRVEPVGVVIRRSKSLKKKKGFNCKSNPVVPPGLGGVKRFASGRRSDDWTGVLEVQSEPLDGGSIWRRRERGNLVDIKVGRDWQSVGPASV